MPLEPKGRTFATSQTLLGKLACANEVEREEAWSRFDRIYTPLLLRWARSWGHGPADADELVQVAKVEFLQKARLGTFAYDPKRGRFRSLLKSILENHGAALARQRRRHRGTGGEKNPAEAAVAKAGKGFDLEETWEIQILREAVEMVRAEYPAGSKTFEAWERVSMKAERPEAVAAALGLSRDSVDQAKFRVLKKVAGIAKELREAYG